VQFWAPQIKNDVKVLQCVQGRTAKLVEGLEGTSYEEQLRTSGLSSLERRKLTGNLLESIFLLRAWSNTGAGFLERWSMPQACQHLTGIWTMP